MKPLRIQRRLFSGPGQRADPAGIRPPGCHSTDAGEGAAVPAAGDDLCHWDSGERGALYHSGSGLCWTSGGQAQGQGAYDLDSRQAGAKAYKVCQKKPHRLWRGIPHQGRRKLVKKTDLGGDEEPVQAGGSGRTKVFPHNLRHLFARLFYRATRDVARLADVLGHSSIETTRIYLISTGAEHARTLDRLCLVC